MTEIDGQALEDVSTTALWTLRSRALESRRPGGLIDDPWAEHLFDSISFDYRIFGRPRQFHVLRALALDAYIRRFLDRHPRAAVVALAEGFQTSFWRLAATSDLAEVEWFSVDLEPVVSLRERLLPPDKRITNIAGSVLDRTWMAHIPGDRPVLITAEGLLMYLPPAEAIDLIADCAQRFPGAHMIFDSIPRRYSERTQRGLMLSSEYTLPPMPFSLSAGETNRLRHSIDGVSEVMKTSVPAGRKLWKLCGYRRLERFEPFRSLRPTVLSFAPAGS